MSEFKCGSDPVIKIVKAAITKLENKTEKNKQISRELSILKKALTTYQEDCSYCKKNGDNDINCLNIALEKLSRQMPFIRNSVYPWLNYDWSYGNFINNNYSAQATGSNAGGPAFPLPFVVHPILGARRYEVPEPSSIFQMSKSSYFKNLLIFFTFFKAYFFSPNPNKKSIAGGTDKNSDYPYYQCQGNNKRRCQATNYIKNKNPQQEPYNDPFFKKHKLSGKYASSYFIKIGACPRQDITNINKCIKKGYDVFMGKCYQPRYAYINNNAGLAFLRGFVPAIADDILSLSPGKLLDAYTGEDINGHLVIQKCPNIKENFTNISEQNFLFRMILSGTTTAIVVIFIALIYVFRTFSK